MMAKITELLQACRDRFAKGEVTKEQSDQEISQLKNTMNTSVPVAVYIPEKTDDPCD